MLYLNISYVILYNLIDITREKYVLSKYILYLKTI